MPERTLFIMTDMQRTGSDSTNRLIPWFLLLCAGSGCAAMIYEVVWLKLLQAAMGLAPASLGIVLGTFLGGMYLGSLLPSRIASRQNPTRVFALLELGLGVFGVVVLFVLPALGHGLSSMLVRTVLAGVCLTLPALLMGATLQAITRWVETTPRSDSWLYGGSLAGAILGCLLAGFYLLRFYDPAIATYVAVLINVVLAVVAFGLSNFQRFPTSEPGGAGTTGAPGALGVYIAIALSGLGIIGGAIAWTQSFSMLSGVATHTILTAYYFPMVLAVLLLGLAIGSATGSFLARASSRPRLLFGICQMLLVAATAWAAGMISKSLPNWPIDQSLVINPWFSFQLELTRCLWTILPAAILWGASLPLALRAVSPGNENPGKLAGGVFGAGTLGSVIGALVFGLLNLDAHSAQNLLVLLSAAGSVVLLVPLLVREQPQRAADAGTTEPLNKFLPWLLLLFVGSGCAALIYEVVWLQLLQLVIGLTAVSLGILLGTFMGGMCLGSLLLPRLVSAQRHPLRVYALLEFGIGIIGVIVLFAVPALAQFYSASSAHGAGSIMLRSLIAAVCLLPPTLLMGATLPAIARWVETTPRGISWLGFFYGGNIAGAVFGCLLAGFYLLRIYNMAIATYVAATINVVLAVIAFALSSFAAHRAPAVEPAAARTLRPQGAGVVYLAIALSGLGALGAEVVWTRLLSLMFGATVYTFSIILAVFLIGLGIGSSAGSFLSRSSTKPRFLFGICQALLVLASAWTALMITRSLPNWPIDPSQSASPWYTFQLDMARCLWTILPAAILWGASFPLALAAVASGKDDPGKLVGGVYAANTVGAILGSIAFSLLVVPLIGSQWGQRLLILLPAASAAILLLPPAGRQRQENAAAARPAFGPGRAMALVLGVGVAVLLAWQVPALPWGAVAFGRFVATYLPRMSPEIIAEKDVPNTGGQPDIFCTYVGEGLNGTVAVTKWKSGDRMFHSAGKVQASSAPQDMRLQRLLGHVSALAVKKPESILVVACGAGVTAGSFVPYPEVKRILICDIEYLVPNHVTPMFELENHAVLKDPRTKVVYDDGRHFIRTTKDKFDVITSDPIDPWVKGCAALNTVDYYKMCKEHLNPGGVVSLWIPLYESNSETIKSVLATFFKVFPKGIIWSNESEGGGYDAVLFGQADGTEFDLDALQARLDRPDYVRVKQSLADVGFRRGIDMLATYAGQAPDLQDWMKDAQINTDSNLRLQYLAGMAFNSYIGNVLLTDIRHHERFPENIFVGSEQAKAALKNAMQLSDKP